MPRQEWDFREKSYAKLITERTTANPQQSHKQKPITYDRTGFPWNHFTNGEHTDPPRRHDQTTGDPGSHHISVTSLHKLRTRKPTDFREILLYKTNSRSPSIAHKTPHFHNPVRFPWNLSRNGAARTLITHDRTTEPTAQTKRGFATIPPDHQEVFPLIGSAKGDRRRSRTQRKSPTIAPEARAIFMKFGARNPIVIDRVGPP